MFQLLIYYDKIFISTTQNMFGVIKILLKGHFNSILILKEEDGIFLGSLWFFKVVLWNWYIKSSKFGLGFNGNELFWTLFCSFYYLLLQKFKVNIISVTGL